MEAIRAPRSAAAARAPEQEQCRAGRLGVGKVELTV